MNQNRDKRGTSKEKQAPKSGTGSSMKDSMKDKQHKDEDQKFPGAPRQWEPARDEGERSDRESIGRPVMLEDGGQGPGSGAAGEVHGAGQQSGSERR